MQARITHVLEYLLEIVVRLFRSRIYDELFQSE